MAESKRMYWDNWGGMMFVLVVTPPLIAASATWQRATAIVFAGLSVLAVCAVREISMAIKATGGRHDQY